MEKVEFTIIGAGVIGLSVAAELSADSKDILVIEKENSFGQGVSSRNSEVIHAGIYYPKDSLKKKTCVEGKGLLYEFCASNRINFKKTGKLIVATDDSDIKDLEGLFKHGLENGVLDLKLLSRPEIKKLEPNVEAKAAIYSPSTGILDSHAFMKKLIMRLEDNTGKIVYNTEAIGIDKTDDGFLVTVKDKKEGDFKFLTRILINCAGLSSDSVSGMVGLGKEEYRLKYCRGEYFRVNQRKANLINRLVYPLPRKGRAGLGIHATVDLAGGLRLGPDDQYVKEIDYNVDISKRINFYESVEKFLPFLELEDLAADMVGIRPKLQGPGEDFRDFLIKDETDNGLLGFINLIGIESPGLTSALSVARIVKSICDSLNS